MPRHFKHWLKSYCEFTAASEAPLDFHFWTGVSTIAACLRRRVWKDELLFKWTPNFYIIFVGPAGVVTKSTTMNIGYKMLEKVPGVFFGPDSMTWHGLAKKFEASFEYAKYPNPKTGKEDLIPMSPITCSVSELGTFLRPDDRGLISFLTDMWDGRERPFDHTTKDSGELKIENPWLNIIGATTPEWMQDNFPASMLQQGIGSRILFVYGEAKRHLVAYPSRVKRPVDFDVMQKQLYEDLIEMSKLIGPFEMTEEAYVWGTDWHEKHHLGGKSTSMASGRYGGYLARKQTHIHKLAMILSAAQRDELLIQKEDLETAEKVLEGVEGSMIKVFESIGVVDEAKHVAELVTYVRTYKWITGPSLYKLCYNIMSEKDFKQAIRIACEGDLLEVVTQNNVRGLSPKIRQVH